MPDAPAQWGTSFYHETSKCHRTTRPPKWDGRSHPDYLTIGGTILPGAFARVKRGRRRSRVLFHRSQENPGRPVAVHPHGHRSGWAPSLIAAGRRIQGPGFAKGSAQLAKYRGQLLSEPQGIPQHRDSEPNGHRSNPAGTNQCHSCPVDLKVLESFSSWEKFSPKCETF